MKQKIIFTLILSLFGIGIKTSDAQKLIPMEQLQNEKIYRSMEEALKSPESVYRLHLRKKKLKKIPQEVYLLKNLNELVLSKNRIEEIPREIAELEALQVLDLSDNRLVFIAEEIGELYNLKRLIIYKNILTHLPPSMGNLVNLEYLDMWSNLVFEFPEEMSKLKNSLKEIDMRVIYMTPLQQVNIKEMFPNSEIKFSRTCNCN